MPNNSNKLSENTILSEYLKYINNLIIPETNYLRLTIKNIIDNKITLP